MSLRTNINVSIQGLLSRVLDQGTQEFRFNQAGSIILPDGSGDSQSNLVFTDTRTLAGNASEELDLAGSLTDPHGVTLTFAAIAAILVVADAGNPSYIRMGAAASNQFLGPLASSTGVTDIYPGGAYLSTRPVDGWPVTGGSADKLKFLNGSSVTAANYSLILIGK